MIIEGKTYLTEKEVSRKFGMSVSWIRKLRYEDNFPFYKMKKKVFFDDYEIESWLKQNLKKSH